MACEQAVARLVDRQEDANVRRATRQVRDRPEEAAVLRPEDERGHVHPLAERGQPLEKHMPVPERRRRADDRLHVAPAAGNQLHLRRDLGDDGRARDGLPAGDIRRVTRRRHAV